MPTPSPLRLPSRPRVPPRPGRTRVIAHRGASALAPENTLAAARLAVAVGADAVECDVRRTVDGALVVVHDHHLRRTTDAALVLPGRGPWRVSELTLDEVRRVDAGGWFAPEYAGEPVPTLAAWAAAVGTRAHLLIEVKQPSRSPGIARDLIAELGHGALARAVTERRVVVQSFDRGWIEALREQAPHVPMGVLMESAPSPREIVGISRFADQLNLSQWVARRDLVRSAHACGLQVHAWTPNSPWQWWRVRRSGVDGLITDHPERVVASAAAR